MKKIKLVKIRIKWSNVGRESITLQVYKKKGIKGSKILSFGTTVLEDIGF